MKTLKEAMKPHGGLAALKLLFKEQGIEVSSQNIQMFNRQAIPSKYNYVVEAIFEKRGIDVRKFIREDMRVNNRPEKIVSMYPQTLNKLRKYGLGKIAARMNETENKKELFPSKPPKRFNHYSFESLLSKKMTPQVKKFLTTWYDVDSELAIDETSQESGLLE